MAGAMPPPHPLENFPEIVLELIFKSLEDSTDIQNVFKVFPSWEGQVPELDNICAWKIDQIAPLIFPWLTKKQVLNCRLVSPRWARAFDRFLGNCQPNGRHNGDPHTSQELHLSREASRAQNQIRHQLDLFSFQYSFNNFDKLAKFLDAMGSHPSSRNPFIGRKVSFSNQIFGEDVDGFWMGAHELLRKFGEHVWYLQMGFDDQWLGNYNGACNLLIRSLPLLPNLRELDITMPFGTGLMEPAALEELLAGILLPHLETLNLAKDNDQRLPPCPIYPLLVERFASQIKKLKISYCHWEPLEPESSELLPNLIELTLFQGNRQMEDVINVLASLRAPELERLELHMGTDMKNVANFQRDIVLWLEPFRKLISVRMVVDLYIRLAYFEFEDVNGDWRLCHPRRMLSCVKPMELLGWVAPALPVSIESVKSLSIEFRQAELGELVNFEFLRSFPNLEYLDVNCRNFQRALYFRELGVYNPQIWDSDGMLPNLKELNLADNGSSKFYTRTGYEWIPELEGLFLLVKWEDWGCKGEID